MATYCVVLRALERGRAVRFYLKANSADRAFVTAMQENPGMRLLGVEMAEPAMPVRSQPHAA